MPTSLPAAIQSLPPRFTIMAREFGFELRQEVSRPPPPLQGRRERHATVQRFVAGLGRSIDAE